MHRSFAFLLPAIVLLASSPAGAIPVVEDAAIVNGEFELAAHHARAVTCPAFGDESVPVFDPDNEQGLPWLASVSPCHAGAVTALQWSHGSGVLFEDFDGDGDREAKILNGVHDPSVGSHNVWQSYASPQQAWTAGFDAFTFRVESGAVPANAAIVLSLSTTPVSNVSPWVGVYIECSLTLRVANFAKEDGTWTADPTSGTFASRYVDCNDERAAWDAASSAEERRAVLAKLRIVQTSFWSFNAGSAPVVLDGVEILGAPTAVEAAAGL